MASNNTSKKHSTGLIVSLVIIAIVLLALIGGLVYVSLSTFSNDDSEDDETSYVLDNDNLLYIGTYYSSKPSGYSYYYANSINISIISSYNCVDYFSYNSSEFLSSDDLDLDGLPDSWKTFQDFVSYSDIGFVNLSDYIYNLSDGFGLSYWCSKSAGNYIQVQTEFSAGSFLSAPVNITQSGLYLINIPEYDGADVQVLYYPIEVVNGGE